MAGQRGGQFSGGMKFIFPLKVVHELFWWVLACARAFFKVKHRAYIVDFAV